MQTSVLIQLLNHIMSTYLPNIELQERHTCTCIGLKLGGRSRASCIQYDVTTKQFGMEYNRNLDVLLSMECMTFTNRRVELQVMYIFTYSLHSRDPKWKGYRGPVYALTSLKVSSFLCLSMPISEDCCSTRVLS